MNAQELGNRPTSRPVHRAGKIRPDGAVSAICSNPPRAINMRTATWTTTDSAVTCARCLAILARALEDAEKVPALIRALQEICLRADCQSFSMGTDITAIAKKAIDAARKKP